MSLALYFNPSAFPRTIPRKEWKELWRWKRIIEKELAKAHEEMMYNLVVFGSTMPDHLREDILDRLTNPPIIMHEKQEHR
jgi:hypothetical protein